MKIEELRKQEEVVRQQIKMASYHADAVRTDLTNHTRSLTLIRELERATNAASKLAKMVVEFNAPSNN